MTTQFKLIESVEDLVDLIEVLRKENPEPFVQEVQDDNGRFFFGFEKKDQYEHTTQGSFVFKEVKYDRVLRAQIVFDRVQYHPTGRMGDVLEVNPDARYQGRIQFNLPDGVYTETLDLKDEAGVIDEYLTHVSHLLFGIKD